MVNGAMVLVPPSPIGRQALFNGSFKFSKLLLQFLGLTWGGGGKTKEISMKIGNFTKQKATPPPLTAFDHLRLSGQVLHSSVE